MVELDDPDRANALSVDLSADLAQTMATLGDDADMRAVVITGRGRAFCAGADLSQLGESREEGLRVIYEGFLAVAESSLVTVAAVNGAAVGAGANLALACDVRIAGPGARFDCRFLQLGIHPGGGHTWMLRRIAGPQAAMATVVFGQVLDGREAERIGLAYRCVPPDDLLEAAHEMAATAASAPRELAIAAKATIAAMADVDTHPEAVERELEPQLWSTRQPWFAERLAALQSRITSRTT